MARTTLKPAFVGHQPYLRELPTDVRPGKVDAIVVPTIDHGKRLIPMAQCAAEAKCLFVPLISGDATPESVGENLAHIKGLKLEAIDVTGFEHRDLKLATDDHPFGQIHSVGDLPVKRNLAVNLGRMLRWRAMFLVDDDMSGATSEWLRLAAGHLREGMLAVGFAGAGFPDHSSIEHAAELTYRESLRGTPYRTVSERARRNLAVSGNSLMLDPSRFDEPFVSFYNEDWLAVLPALLQYKVGILGRMIQLPYEPFDGKRAFTQEPGEVLTQGVFDLGRRGRGLGDADIAFWEIEQRNRLIRLGQLARSLQDLTPDHAAVADKEFLESELRNSDPAAYETQELKDELASVERYLLAREQSPAGIELREKVMATIELARSAHADIINPPNLSSGVSAWRQDHKKIAETRDALPKASSLREAASYYGLRSVGSPEPSSRRLARRHTLRSTRHAVAHTQKASSNKDFFLDLPDGHRLYGKKHGDPAGSTAAVLFVHGLGGAPDLSPMREWVARLHRIRKDLLVVSPNLYHEEKDLARSSRDCTMATSVNDLEFLLANTPELADLPLVVVGHGLGGLVSTALSPQRVGGLVLVNPNHPHDGLFNQESIHLSMPGSKQQIRMRFGVGGIDVPAGLREEYQNWPAHTNLRTIAENNVPVRIVANSSTSRFARDYQNHAPGSELTTLNDANITGPSVTRAVMEAIQLAARDAVPPASRTANGSSLPVLGETPPHSTSRIWTPSPPTAPGRGRIRG